VIAGTLLIGSEGYLIIRFAVAILALIVATLVWQAGQWWWAVPMAAVAVLWNPVLPIPIEGWIWTAAHYVAALVFVLVGLLVRTRVEPARG
jgi:hypothetical protein